MPLGPDQEAERGRDAPDAAPDAAFEALRTCAARLLDCPTALLSLAEASWQQVRSDPAVTRLSPEHSFCQQVVRSDAPLLVADAARDARFERDPLVLGAPHVRFYAGVPIRNGARPIGALCVLSERPRTPDGAELVVLRELGRVAEMLLDARFAAAASRDAAHDAQRRLHLQGQGVDRFEQAERLANIGSWRLDLASFEIAWSPHTFRIFGLETRAGGPMLEAVLELYPEQDRELIMQAIDRAIETGTGYDVETNVVTATGERRRIRNVGEVEKRDGEAVALIGICQDVTSRYDMEQALERSAKHDELTGSPNRAALNAYLHERVDTNRMVDRKLAVLLIDLDNFKTVNDTYGHAAGDEVLKTIAAKLQARAKALGFAARLGGDEFVLAITNPLALHGLRATLQSLLGELTVTVPGEKGDIRVAATIGCCWLEPGIHSKSDLLKRADLALYSAKALGKGRAIVSGDLRPISLVQAVGSEERQAG